MMPDHGTLSWNNTDLRPIPTHRRNFGLMFQDYALFPHKNVFENVAFGLRMAGLAEADIQTGVTESLRLVGLPGFAQRDVNNLSGGEQQRVALARAIVIEPEVLLLDEPLSNLDARLRVETRAEIRRLQRSLGITAIYVTHDQEEALALSDRIAVMEKGRILQVGPPAAVYTRPASRFVAGFLGRGTFLEGRLARIEAGRAYFAAEGAEIPAAAFPDGLEPGARVLLLIRPEDVRVTTGDVSPSPASWTVRGKITALEYLGAHVRLEIRAGEVALQAYVLGREATGLDIDAEVTAQIPAEAVCVVERLP
jgi:iron(III) transport system ATP-binding protein